MAEYRRPDDPLAAYERRRLAPQGEARRHRPWHGGGSHVRPGEPRVLLEWDGFAYQVAGIAPDLPAARAWVSEAVPPQELQ
ncbi:DUF6087 family protein [Streptomyces sp. NPDC002536]|uniref:DUF6087 family protein n=1 Tax=Streptomyces TaxID=1883 RepID=UPI00300F8494